MSKLQRELRVRSAPASPFTVRKNADGTRTASGYFATFGTLSHDLGFREVLTRGCFADSLRRQPVQCLFNHDNGKLLGRTESGTLLVQEDSKGLRFEVLLPETSYARDLVALMERGDAYECSFGFSVPDGGDDWSQMPNGELLRTVNTAILYEGSILVSPAAYPNTSANVRSCPSGLCALLPESLRSKRSDSGARFDDCDEDEQDADGNCPDDPDYDEDSRGKRAKHGECACRCKRCVEGRCDECSMTDCRDENCDSCPYGDDGYEDEDSERKCLLTDLLLRRA